MNKRQAAIFVGLGFGDCGKGATTDYWARRHGASLIIRFNGGPQCGHSVCTADGRHHTFAQFGSGTFAGAATHLSRFMLINPLNMATEEKHLREVGVNDAFDRLTVDEGCIVITPFQRAYGRLLEWSRGSKAHGSCGQGLGQARSDQIECGDKVLYAGDLRDEKVARSKLEFLQQRARNLAQQINPDLVAHVKESSQQFAVIFDDGVVDWLLREYAKVPLRIVVADHFKLLMERHERVVFEGGQGVLLDETYGTAPFNTWTDTTCRNATRLLSEVGYDGTVRRIGVLRTYFTRHGNGPFPTEDWRLAAFLPEKHNSGVGFQGEFRRGHFDAVAARYALNVSGGVSEIALTHIDALSRMCGTRIRIDEKGPADFVCESGDPTEFIDRIEKLLRVPVTIVSSGPTAADRAERGPVQGDNLHRGARLSLR